MPSSNGDSGAASMSRSANQTNVENPALATYNNMFACTGIIM